MKKNLIAASLHMEETENAKNKKNPTLKELINRIYQEDFLPRRVLQLLVNRANYSKSLTLADYAILNNKLQYRDRFYVPAYHPRYLYLCRLHYNSPHTGYLGIDKTYKQLHRNYYWPKMQGFIRKYVCHYDIYKRSKGSQFKK